MSTFAPAEPTLSLIERFEGDDVYHFTANDAHGLEWGLMVTVRTEGPNVFVPCIQRHCHNEAGIDLWTANTSTDTQARRYRDTAATFAHLWADGMITPNCDIVDYRN